MKVMNKHSKIVYELHFIPRINGSCAWVEENGESIWMRFQCINESYEEFRERAIKALREDEDM